MVCFGKGYMLPLHKAFGAWRKGCEEGREREEQIQILEGESARKSARESERERGREREREGEREREKR